MPTLTIMCGLAFSGKSTLARAIADQTGATLVSFDALWVLTDKERLVPQGVKGWRFIRDAAQAEIRALLLAGTSCVYDDVSVRREHREELRRVASEVAASGQPVRAVVVYLDTPLTVIRARQEGNNVSGERHEVDPAMADEVAKQLEMPVGSGPDAEGEVLVFRPGDDVEDFISKLK
jgi:predicted kinase